MPSSAAQIRASAKWTAANRERANQSHKQWRDANPDLVLRSRLKQYGTTVDEYKALVARQGGRCAICGNMDTGASRLSVDHDHETGEVRGLLCRSCNGKVGWLERNLAKIKQHLGEL